MPPTGGVGDETGLPAIGVNTCGAGALVGLPVGLTGPGVGVLGAANGALGVSDGVVAGPGMTGGDKVGGGGTKVPVVPVVPVVGVSGAGLMVRFALTKLIS